MLKVSHISKTFTGGIIKKTRVEAVKDVSFTVQDGKTFGIVGNSGCGKSTIANMLLSLIKPDSGTIEIDGTIQIIFQHPETSLDPAKKIGYSLEEPMIIHRMYDKAGRKARVRELLDLVDLGEELLDRYPHQISGGEAQRIMIARALSLDPKILILDEPTSMLDVSVQAQVMTLLKELQEKLGLSYLFISHDLSVVRHISDRIAVMYLGSVVEVAEKAQLYSNPMHPYTKALLSAIPLPDVKKKRQRIILEGDVPSAYNPPSGCKFHTRCPYATDRCRQEAPVLQEVEKGHKAACHRALELA